jgi:hypothetical protein
MKIRRLRGGWLTFTLLVRVGLVHQVCQIRKVFRKVRKADSSGLRPFGMTRFMGI